MACTTCGGTATSSSTCACNTSAGAISWPCTTALPGGLTRTRFFEGMSLTRDDLATEQSFWIQKRRLTNRALGQGVVWGLRTTWTSGTHTFQINPGYALDCCGRDLVVTQSHVADLGPLVDIRQPAIAAIVSQAAGPAKARLVLRHADAAEGQRAVASSACTPGVEDRFEPSRVRESTSLCVVAVEESPPSPVDDFKAQLEAALGTPDAPAFEPEVPFVLRVHAAGETIYVQPVVLESGVWVFDTAELAIVSSSLPEPESQDLGEVTFDFELRAQPGWAFVSGEVSKLSAVDLSAPLATAQPPGDLSLAWSVTVPFGGSQGATDANGDVYLQNVVVAKLFSATERIAVPDVELLLLLERAPTKADDDLAQVDGAYIAQFVVATAGDGPPTTPSPAAPIAPDCFAPLQGLGNDPRPIVLAALYAWLQRGPVTDTSGQALLAWWAYVVAWRLLYGVEGVGPVQDLSSLLNDLLLRWCDGFVYPGPRCATDHEGVVLGTLTLSSTGAVTDFSPWEGRRHVLTGPLLEHWLGQLGMSAPDVLVNRIVQTLCCVTQVNTQGLVPLVHSTARFLTEQFGVTSQSGAEPGAIGLSGGAAVLVGTDGDVQELLERQGWQIVRAVEVTAWQLATTLATTFGAALPEPTPYYIHHTVTGATGRRLHVLLPAQDADLAQFDEETARLRSAIDSQLSVVGAQPGALGRQALSDLVLVLMRDLALYAVEPGPRTLITALREAAQPSLGNFLARGPEGGLALLASVGVTASVADFNALWVSAERQLNINVGRIWSGVEAWSAVHGLFTRDSLGQRTLHEQLATSLTDGTAENTLSNLVAFRAIQAAAFEATAMG